MRKVLVDRDETPTSGPLQGNCQTNTRQQGTVCVPGFSTYCLHARLSCIETRLSFQDANAPLTFEQLKSFASPSQLTSLDATPFLHNVGFFYFVLAYCLLKLPCFKCRVCRVHGMLPVFNYAKRLERRVNAIHFHDIILKNDALIDTLTTLQLQQVCLNNALVAKSLIKWSNFRTCS